MSIFLSPKLIIKPPRIAGSTYTINICFHTLLKKCALVPREINLATSLDLSELKYSACNGYKITTLKCDYNCTDNGYIDFIFVRLQQCTPFQHNFGEHLQTAIFNQQIQKVSKDRNKWGRQGLTNHINDLSFILDREGWIA